MPYPRMYRIRQTFEAPRVDDVAAEVERQLARLALERTVRPGQSVAITAGSRGIANIAAIIRAAVAHFHRLDARPFIVPAMGSHGGGTAEGQRAILESYGITSESIGAEIRASMETVIVDRTPLGTPVYFDRLAYEADHVLVCGRVKPHTGFVGPIESGLHKMMLIGLGKHDGARIYHRAIMDHSFLEIIRAVADVVLERCRIVAGLAIVENAYDETGLIEAVAPRDFFEREQELLMLARRWMPRLPFPAVDLLIIDAIGKNISGSGMDTNVVGRKYNDHAATAKDDVACKRIFIRGLTRETHGNACGLGLAEFTTDRCLAQVDFSATRINALTGGHPTAAAVPVSLPTDRDVLDAALETVGLVEPARARVVQIPDTLHLREVLVSEAWAGELRERADLEIIAGPDNLQFDTDGFLAPVVGEQ
ncbi:MAG TPA: lactate racemase domain-containing protein [Planctomycetaceae bacterium]|nr:lactate racemase domain-containing protein [Planctomycetaceae bacterium]